MKKLFIGLLVIFGLASGGLFMVKNHFEKRPLPQKMALKGLKSSVKITFDQWDIPHIEAETEEDLYHAFGYVAASRRLFQMDIQRRVGNGELSEIYGKKVLHLDKLLRALGFRRKALEKKREGLFELNPTLKKYVDSYLTGINTYIEKGPIPIEFHILGYRPRPFSEEDLLAFAGYLAFSFNESFKGDLFFSKLKYEKGESWFQEMRALENKGKNPGEIFSSKNNNLKDLKLEGLFSYLRPSVASSFSLKGSNSWVISGSKTKSGKPILGNDPHIKFSNPGTWFEAHLKTPNHEIYGHFSSLLPFALLGHNTKYGWALTMSEVDDWDYFQEKLSDDGKSVLYKQEWVPLKSSQEKIKVKGEDKPVTLEFAETPHGPLIHEIMKEKVPLSFQWAFYHKDNNPIEMFYRLNHEIKSLSDVPEALKFTMSPGVNVSYADIEGNIGWWVVGGIPKRPSHLKGDTAGIGWTGQDDWLGFLPFEENPKLVNPRRGFIVSTNNRPWWNTEEKEKQIIPGHYRPLERYSQIVNPIAKKNDWDLEQLKLLINENKAPLFQEVNQYYLEIGQKGKLNDFENKVISILSNWDGSTGAKEIAPSIFYVWTDFNQASLFKGKFPEKEAKLACQISPTWDFYKNQLGDPDSKWWDNPLTPKFQEGREDILLNNLKKTISYLKEELGSNPKYWEWGKIHTVEFGHPLGKNFFLRPIFNVGPFAAPGGNFQLNNLKYKRCRQKFDVHAGPSTRRLIDFGNPGVSLGILPIGNSGLVFSPHYQDQAELFFKGEMREQVLDLTKLDKSKIRTIEFKPL